MNYQFADRNGISNHLIVKNTLSHLNAVGTGLSTTQLSHAMWPAALRRKLHPDLLGNPGTPSKGAAFQSVARQASPATVQTLARR